MNPEDEMYQEFLEDQMILRSMGADVDHKSKCTYGNWKAFEYFYSLEDDKNGEPMNLYAVMITKNNAPIIKLIMTEKHTDETLLELLKAQSTRIHPCK